VPGEHLDHVGLPAAPGRDNTQIQSLGGGSIGRSASKPLTEGSRRGRLQGALAALLARALDG
jgi:hypothetical protein